MQRHAVPAKPDEQEFTRINLDALPAMLRTLVSYLGERLAFKLVSLRGGQTLLIPKKLSPDHSLVYELGFESAAKLVDSFGGEVLQIPKDDSLVRQLRHRRVVELIDSGATYNRVAQLTGYSRRHAISIGKQSGGIAPERQLDMFGAAKWHEMRAQLAEEVCEQAVQSQKLPPLA